MKVRHVPSDEEIKALREREYLERWPVPQQLEALSEASLGRPEKLERMAADFAKIRKAHPYFSA